MQNQLDGEVVYMVAQQVDLLQLTTIRQQGRGQKKRKKRKRGHKRKCVSFLMPSKTEGSQLLGT